MSSQRILPNWINSFMEMTEDSEPPILFRKWTAISAIASALQRKVYLKLGISLVFYPNFYIVLVGPSATGKGTAMKYASDIIKEVSTIRMSAQATSLQALIRRMKDVNLTDVDPINGKQLYHSSMTILSNEFTVFLGYHNQELIAALCDWYDCHERWTYDTIKRDREEIIGVWVNLLAGTTPDALKNALPLEAIGGGLTSRIIFIMEEKKSKLVVFPSINQEIIDLQQSLIHDLSQISLMTGEFKMTKDCMGEYYTWCVEADKNPPFYDKNFDGYCGRRRSHLLALSMVCSASRSNDLIIESEDLLTAGRYLAEAEMKMGTVFSGMGMSDISELISSATIFINNFKTPDIPVWRFSRHFEKDMDKFTMDKVLQTLESSKHIKTIRKPGCENIIHRLTDDFSVEELDC